MQQTAATQNATTRQSYVPTAILLLAIIGVLVFLNTANAGADIDAFEDVWTTIKDWTQGTLGKIIAGAMILVGIIGGVARQSLMAFAVGIAGGMGLNYAPQIIETIMTASIESASATVPAAQMIGNGLGL